jgi:hypothetical protein
VAGENTVFIPLDIGTWWTEIPGFCIIFKTSIKNEQKSTLGTIEIQRVG